MKFMPKKVLNANLKKGEMIAREDNNGIVVLNGLVTRYVLTAKHAPEMVDINVNSTGKSRQKNTQKPLPICEYNTDKAGIDISDQIGFYAIKLLRHDQTKLINLPFL